MDKDHDAATLFEHVPMLGSLFAFRVCLMLWFSFVLFSQFAL